LSGNDPTEQVEVLPKFPKRRWERMGALICLVLVLIVGLDPRDPTTLKLIFSIALCLGGILCAVRTCLNRHTRTFGVLLLGLYLLVLLMFVVQRWWSVWSRGL